MIGNISNNELASSVRSKFNLIIDILNNFPDPAAAGSILFSVGVDSAGLNQWSSSSLLYWDNANKRLGIGTSSPTRQLHLAGTGTAVALAMTKTDITIPNYTTIGWTEQMIAFMGSSSSGAGGMQFSGFTSQGTGNGNPLIFTGYHGSSGSITTGAITFRGAKWNGTTSATTLADTEPLLEFKNWTAATAVATMLANGNLGIGIAAPTSILHLVRSGITGTDYGIQSAMTTTPTADASYTCFAGLFRATKTGAFNMTSVGLNGFLGQTQQNGSGTIAIVEGVSGHHRSDAAGVTTLALTFRAKAPTIAAGTITEIRGVHIDAGLVAGVTTAWGIYQVGASDANYFAGNVGIGTNSIGCRLQLGYTSGLPASTFASYQFVIGNADNAGGLGFFAAASGGTSIIKTRFEILRIQGGVNDANPRDVYIGRGDTGNAIWVSSRDTLPHTQFTGRVGIGGSADAYLHLAAGTATAKTAPLRFTSGTVLTTPETGAVEYNGRFRFTNGNSIRTTPGGVLFSYSATVGNVVASGETDLYSSTLPANLFSSDGDRVEVQYDLQISGSGPARTFAVYVAGTNIKSPIDPLLSDSINIRLSIVRDSSTSVKYTITTLSNDASNQTSIEWVKTSTLTGLTLSNTMIVKVTGSSAGGADDDVRARHGVVKFFPAA